MKENYVLSKDSLNEFLGLNHEEMSHLKGGLVSGGGPYYPTGGGGGGDDPWLPVEEKPRELEPFCEEGYVWDNVLNRCVLATSR